MKQEQLRKLWEQRIKDFEDSNITMKAWCEVNQLKIHQLHYWRRKLKNNNEIQTPALIPIDFNQMNQDTLVKLQVGSISIEVKPGFNPALLKDVMKVLMELC